MLTEETLMILPDGAVWTGSGDAPALPIQSLVRRDAAGRYVTHWERLAPAQRTLVAETRTAAGALILAHLPLHDQMNMLTTSSALIARFGGLAHADRAEGVDAALDAFDACTAWIRAVRAASRTIADTLAGAQTFAAIIAVDTDLPPPPHAALAAADLATRQAWS